MDSTKEPDETESKKAIIAIFVGIALLGVGFTFDSVGTGLPTLGAVIFFGGLYWWSEEDDKKEKIEKLRKHKEEGHITEKEFKKKKSETLKELD